MPPEMDGMSVMEGGERVEQPTVATVDAGPQRLERRRQPQMPAAITADETDAAKDAQQPDVGHDRRRNKQRSHKHSTENLHNYHDPPSNASYSDSIVTR